MHKTHKEKAENWKTRTGVTEPDPDPDVNS